LAWKVSYTDTAKKQLRHLDPPMARPLLDSMDERVADQPDPRSTGKALRGPVLGLFWRYRVGNYRIICDLQDATMVILVLQIGRRKDVYP
jgi:mRNA interferase RelE/StbE